MTYLDIEKNYFQAKHPNKPWSYVFYKLEFYALNKNSDVKHSVPAGKCVVVQTSGRNDAHFFAIQTQKG